MPMAVVGGASCSCTFGTTPGTINPTSKPNVKMGGQPVATVMDCAPGTNITPFGMCSSLANPAVASATSAAMGVLTPQPCMPVFPGPWMCMGKVRAGGPVLTKDGTIMCAYGGTVTVNAPGQVKVKL